MVVFTNGCFDILHRGHLELFSYAKSLGHKLIVGVDSDKKVANDKGCDRPINCLMDRMIMLAAIRDVDEVHSFDSKNELADLVCKISPNIMVVGSDWKGKNIVGGEYAGEVRYFDRIDNYSTTSIIDKIGRNYNENI